MESELQSESCKRRGRGEVNAAAAAAAAAASAAAAAAAACCYAALLLLVMLLQLLLMLLLPESLSFDEAQQPRIQRARCADSVTNLLIQRRRLWLDRTHVVLP